MKTKAIIVALMLLLTLPSVFGLIWYTNPYWMPVGTANPLTIDFGDSATAKSGSIGSLEYTGTLRVELRKTSGELVKLLVPQKQVYFGGTPHVEVVTITQADYKTAGSYYVRFIAADSKESEQHQLTLIVKQQSTPTNNPPTISCPSTKTVDENSPLTFYVSGSDPDAGDTILFSATNLPTGASFDKNTKKFSWTPNYDQAGTYKPKFTVTDSHGASADCTTTITVNDKNRCPSLGYIKSDWTVMEGSTVTITASGSDPDGDSLSFSASGTPLLHGAVFDSNTKTFTWTPNSNQVGDYTVDFSVSDGKCPAVTQQVTIHVTAKNVPVVQLTASPTSGPEGTTVSFSCTATGGDGTLVYELDFGDGSAKVNSQVATHKYEFANIYTASCKVTDSDSDSGTDTETITITDNKPSVDLVVTPSKGNAPLEVEFDCQVTGGNSPMKSYLIDFGDGNSATTGTAKHTYTVKKVYAVSCTVVDADGDMASDSASVEVTENACPVLAPIGDKSVQVGDTLAFTLSATDADGDTLTFSADVPMDKYLTGDKFSLTPVALQVGNHAATFRVTDGTCPDSETINIEVTAAPVKPQCDDGIDNDGDGKTDLADPGCADKNDDDETDTPACYATVAFNSSQGIKYLQEMGSGDGKVKTPSGAQVHFKEAISSTDYNIDKNDILVMSHGDVTRMVRFDSVDKGNSLVGFTDIGTGSTLHAQYSGTQNSGTINLGGWSFDFSVDLVNEKLAVDLNDDGVINGGSSFITSCSGGSCTKLVIDLSCKYECNDGKDNDLDLLKDLADPGCASMTDDNETDPVTPPANQPPVADFTWTPLEPEVGETVTFTSTSTDPENDPLTCEWDFDADKVIDATGCSATHVFKTPGQHPVTLNVSDGSLSDLVMKMVNVTGQLNVTGITCFDPVVEKHFQSCSVKVEGSNKLAVGGVNVKLHYLNGTQVGNCLTDSITGNCGVTFPSGEPGKYTVYATAEKTGWKPDLDKDPTDEFEVYTTKYSINNLMIYNDSAFLNEDYDFFRYEYMYVKFTVVDMTTGQPTEDVVTSVALESPIPGGVAWFTKFPWNNPAKGEYHYVLRIPKTHDFLGLSEVYTFAFNFTDKTGGQHKTMVTIRNNPPVIDNNVVNEFNNVTFDQQMSLSLTPYESDIEDSGSNLSWTVMGVDQSVVKISIADDDTMTVTPVSPGLDVVTLMLWDLDGDTDTIDIPISTGSPYPQCSDGVDNDGDGLVDWPNDPGCADAADDNETDPAPKPQCDDGLDNDGDGLIDLADPGCTDVTDDNETDPAGNTQCSDLVDNDGDGLVDMNDPGCTDASDDDETDPVVSYACSDLFDNDGDGLADIADPGCWDSGAYSATDDNETDTLPACSNFFDDDGDGLVDMNDPGCSDPNDTDETDPVSLPQCSDNVDNDGDGLIDLNDPGCTDASDDDETDPVTTPQCSDNVDNDGDGLVDMNDPGCSSPGDDDETDPVPTTQCNDGIDNDGDGLVDMNDPGCSSTSDDDETDPAANLPPVADIKLSRSHGAPGVVVNVDGSKSYDSDGTIAGHVWLVTGPNNYTYTSSNTGNAGSFNIQFNSLGTYTVRLTVTDDDGASDTETKTVSIGTGYAQCDDGIDNDGDGKVDWPADPHCGGKTDNLEGEIFIPGPDRPFRDQDDLLVTRIDVNGFDVEGYAVSPGEYLQLSLGLQNNLDVTLDDIKVDASIQELGVRDSDLLRELDSGDSATVVFNLDIPYYAEPGLYDVRFVISNDDVRRVKYRTITIA